MNDEKHKIDRLIDGLRLCGISGRGMFSRIAERTGYTLSMVGKVLSGKVEMGERFVKVVCGAFGINEEWVLEGKEPVVTNDQPTRLIPTNDWTGRPPVTLEGERLKVVREALGYSLEEMAQQLDIDTSILQRCEKELFLRDTQILRKLALIGVNSNWLMTGRGMIRLNDWPITITKRDGKEFYIDDLFTTRVKRTLGNRTTEWLSNESHISLNKLEKIIAGGTIPLVDELELIAKALGNINPHWLAGTESSPSENWKFEYYRDDDTAFSRVQLQNLYQAALEDHIASLQGLYAFSQEKKAHVINVACRVHMKELPDSNEVNLNLIITLARLAVDEMRSSGVRNL